MVSLLIMEIKPGWNSSKKKFSKLFEFERNKQNRRVLWNETIKQLAVQKETLEKKRTFF